MLEKVKDFVASKNLPFEVAALLSLYLWNILSPTTYKYFMLGVVATLVTEGIVYWQYLTQKVWKETGQKMNLELASFELKRIFGKEVGVNYHAVEKKIQKKNYYVNNKSKFLMLSPVHKAKVEGTTPSNSNKLKLRSQTSIEGKPTFSHKPMNELLKMKEKSGDKQKEAGSLGNSPNKTNFEERALIIKIGHKNFNEQLTDYLQFLKCISSSEKIYGKALHNIITKNEINCGPLQKLFLEKEEAKTDAYGIDSLNEEELAFLKRKFGEHIEFKQVLILPQWKAFKDSISLVGKIHFNCSFLVSQVSVQTIDMMSEEYNEKYALVKEEKKKIARDYEDAYFHYFKLKNEYENLYKSLQSALDDYQIKFKKKETDEVVLRYEMKARLLKSQLDSLKNKLVHATDKLKDMVKAVSNENNKLELFIKDWNLRKGSVCQNVLRSVVSMLEECAVDSERVFEKLIANIDDLYCSFQDLDEIDNHREEHGIEERNDVIARVTRRLSFFKSPTKPLEGGRTPRDSMPIQSLESKPALTEADLEAKFKELKNLFTKYNENYNKETEKYQEELKKSKEIISLLEFLLDSANQYLEEKAKLMTFNPFSLDLPNLNVYWTIVQENIRLVTNLSAHLREKLTVLQKSYEKNVKNFEKEFKNSGIIVNNAVKRASGFIKAVEKDVGAKSFTQIVRKWFTKTATTKAAEQGSSGKGPNTDANKIFDKEEDPIGAEREYLKNDFKIGLTQIKNATSGFHKEALNLKKDLILSYLQCYSNQKELLLALVKEIDKISHFSENFDQQIQELGSDDDNDADEQELPELQYDRVDSLVEPIKITKPPEIEIEEEKEDSVHSQEETTPSEIHHKANELIWINKMLSVFVLEWSRSAYFKEKIMKSLYTAFNKKKAKLIRQIKVKNFVLGEKPIEVRGVTNLPSDRFEFLCDIELAFQGNICLDIEVQFESQPILNMLNKDKPLFIDVKILLKSLNGKIRICWVPTIYGTSWFSFVGQPILDLQIEPKVGQTQFDLTAIPHVTNILRDFLDQKLRKMTYPYRKELDLPMAFRTLKVLPLADDQEYDNQIKREPS